ncbi:MAG: MarR family transcriptional regulator [Bifidobacteriaceae bacterium]|nr:MarR family transcriptional regulator [Bifidobacteriaceae bacterium]
MSDSPRAAVSARAPAFPSAAATVPAPQDATARVVEAWRRQRPDLDAAPLEVFSRVTRLAKYLDQVRQAVFERHRLQGWEFDVLAELRRSGSPYQLTPGQMSAEMLVSSGTMTNRIDRLQAAGLVQRREDPSDGRVIQVRLTKPGLARVDEAMADLVRREAELIEGIEPAGRAAAAATLAALLEPLEARPPSAVHANAAGGGPGARRGAASKTRRPSQRTGGGRAARNRTDQVAPVDDDAHGPGADGQRSARA